MYLNKAKFITSMQKYNEEALEALPQIAIVGKSNVGKSSFINCITNNGKLCKVGQTPGKTRLINFFMAEESFYLVDLPGYGYAKRSDKEIEGWGRMIEDYLKKTSRLKHIVLLVDIRNKVSQGDKDMLNWILYYEKEPIVVCTKAEKLGKTRRIPACKKIAEELLYDGEILPIDSYSGYGREKIVETIKNKLQIS